MKEHKFEFYLASLQSLVAIATDVCVTMYIHITRFEPIMLKNLPIIPSQNLFIILNLFTYYILLILLDQ